jgi:hypothetical protein
MGTVYVEGNHEGGGDFWCRLTSQTEDGSSGTYVDWDEDSNSAAGLVQLSMAVDGTSGNEGTFGLECVLPGGSSLFHYLAEEDTSSSSE